MQCEERHRRQPESDKQGHNNGHAAADCRRLAVYRGITFYETSSYADQGAKCFGITIGVQSSVTKKCSRQSDDLLHFFVL